MPGIDMVEVATLIQYWVRGFFGSAADAEDAKQAIITAVTAQVVFLRRLMVISSLEKVCLMRVRGFEGEKVGEEGVRHWASGISNVLTFLPSS
jgi:hypothetical protein